MDKIKYHKHCFARFVSFTMKALSVAIFVCLSASIECGRGHGRGHFKVYEMCSGDPACMENGRMCFKGLKMAFFKNRSFNPEKKMQRKENMEACFNEQNLLMQFNEFAIPEMSSQDDRSSEDLPDFDDMESMENDEVMDEQMSRDHQHHKHMGHGGRRDKKKVKAFMRTLEETNPEAATTLRCCLINNMPLINEGAIDKDALKEKIRTALPDEILMQQKNSLIEAVDECGELVDCKVKDYAKCLIEKCITME